MNMPREAPAGVVTFWREVGSERWFKKDPALDDEIRRRFLPLHEAAAAGKLDDWQESPEGNMGTGIRGWKIAGGLRPSA